MVPSIGILYCCSLQQYEYIIKYTCVYSSSFPNIVTVYNIFSKGQIDQSSLYRLLCNQILYDCMNNLLISEWMLISEREK